MSQRFQNPGNSSNSNNSFSQQSTQPPPPPSFQTTPSSGHPPAYPPAPLHHGPPQNQSNVMLNQPPPGSTFPPQPPYNPHPGPPNPPYGPSFNAQAIGPPTYNYNSMSAGQPPGPYGPASHPPGAPFTNTRPPMGPPPQGSFDNGLRPAMPPMGFHQGPPPPAPFGSQGLQPPGPPPPGQFHFSQPPPMPSHQPPLGGQRQLNPPPHFAAPPPFTGHTSFDNSKPPPPPSGHSYKMTNAIAPTNSFQQLLNSTSSKDTGRGLLDAWLQKSKRAKKFQKQQTLSSSDNIPKLWEFTQHLYEMSQLMDEMSSQIEDLDKVTTTTDNATWDASIKKLNGEKMQYIKMQSAYTETHIEQLEKKMKKARQKRARIKRARKEKFALSVRLKEESEEKGKQIDAWQERCTSELKEENKKKSRKAAADKTLSKVNKEIHDANRLIETMTALQKLRLVRRDAAEKRGDADLGESRESFEQKIADMIRLVKGQLEFYKEEEARLKSIIKSEVEESNKKEKEQMEEKDRVKQAEEDAELKSMLFGPEDEVHEADPLFPFVQYYKQAEYSLEAFLNIRHQWDTFVATVSTPGASCVPSTWVIPEEPKNNVWASALK